MFQFLQPNMACEKIYMYKDMHQWWITQNHHSPKKQLITFTTNKSRHVLLVFRIIFCAIVPPTKLGERSKTEQPRYLYYSSLSLSQRSNPKDERGIWMISSLHPYINIYFFLAFELRVFIAFSSYSKNDKLNGREDSRRDFWRPVTLTFRFYMLIANQEPNCSIEMLLFPIPRIGCGWSYNHRECRTYQRMITCQLFIATYLGI